MDAKDVLPAARDPSNGDPQGRRIARRKAAILAEAGRVSRALEILLTRAAFDPASIRKVSDQIARQERIELQRATGHLEPRGRFKGRAPQPLTDDRASAYLYLDEAGKSFPEPRSAHPTDFALGAVCLSEEAATKYRSDADLVKIAFFDRTDITFHEPGMRQHAGPFFFQGDQQKQDDFDAAITDLVRRTEFTVFGVGVRKHAFEEEFARSGLDPYLPTDAYATAITMLLERYVDHLAMSPVKLMGQLTFESQGPKEDALHQLEYARVLLEGSQWVTDKSFRQWLRTGLLFTPKHGSDPTELADIVSREIFEWIRSNCDVAPRLWAELNAKVYLRGDGSRGKFGVKVFPDADIRERVERHRSDCGVVGG